LYFKREENGGGTATSGYEHVALGAGNKLYVVAVDEVNPKEIDLTDKT